MKLKDKTIIVTGAGGGVGRQLVLQLLQKGASVSALDINEDRLNETKRLAMDDKDRVSIHIADIGEKSRMSAILNEISSTMGPIDGLINNAGIIQPFITVAEIEARVIDQIMNINFFGLIHLTRAVIPYLAERPEAHITNVSSMGGFLPVPGQSVYGASKAAVKIATEGLREELSQTNIGVSLVIPGGIETDIIKNSGLEATPVTENEKKSAGFKLTTPENAAATILKGIEKKKSKIIVGKDALIMDILYRLSPERATRLISKVMSRNHGDVINRTEDLARISAREVKLNL